MGTGVCSEMYDVAKLSPVFLGYSFEKIGLNNNGLGLPLVGISKQEDSDGKEIDVENDSSLDTHWEEYESRETHTACYGFKLAKILVEERRDGLQSSGPKKMTKIAKDKQLPARQYLEKEVFSILMPALEAMLGSAKENNVLRWKRTKFNACDYLTEYLYNNNPNTDRREKIDLWDIPFVQRINTEKPRPPLPLSLLWTEDEAAIVIQSCWRGRKVRMDSEVQELIQYQKEMREQEYDIMLKVEDFWKKHPVEDPCEETTANES